MAAKTSFVTLRNNANSCQLPWKRRSRYDFFFTKRCVTDITAITNKREKNLYPFKQEARKAKSWVQVDPLMHLNVKWC